MNNIQINSTIAQACGWFYYDGWHHPDGRNELPDYVNDLNAMRDVEKCVEDRNKYLNVLAELTEGLEATSVDNDWFFCRATARQRAEAFLRTLDKWEK